MALQLENICMHPSLGYVVLGTTRVSPPHSAPGHGRRRAGICVSPYNPGTDPTGVEAVASSSCWSTQFLHSLLGERWGSCQPQGAWQRDVATLPAAHGVIPAMRVPWRPSRECQRSSSETVQLATSSKQRYSSLSSKCAHSAALGAVRLREEGWVDQSVGGKPRPVPGTCCRLTALPLTFQALHAKPGASQNPRWRAPGF